MTKVRSKIYETPDYYTDDNGHEVIWHQGELRPVTFGWFDGILYTLAGNPDKSLNGTDRTITHSQLGDEIMGELPDEHPKNQTINTDGWSNTISRSDFVFPGRLWIVNKVITFWKFPDKNSMKGVLKELEDELNIDILSDPDWRIEIVEGGDGLWGKNKATLIPISKYMGSGRVPKSQLAKQHEMSPLLKNKKKVPYGVGSNSKKRKPLKYKQAMYAESLQLSDLSNLLLEKLLMGEPVTVPELRQILNTKILNFEFVKLDGEVRPAKGTTMMKYIPKDDQPSGLNSPSSDKVAAFYDLSKNAWRSVSNKSKDVVIATDTETGKPKIVISDKKPKEEKEPKPPTVDGKPSPRPVIPPAQPVVKPTIVPDNVPNVPDVKSDDFGKDFDDREKPLNMEDPNVVVDDIKDDEIIVDDVPDELQDFDELDDFGDKVDDLEDFEDLEEPTIYNHDDIEEFDELEDDYDYDEDEEVVDIL